MNRHSYFKSIRSKILLITASVMTLIGVITVSVCFAVFESFSRKSAIQSAEYNLQVIASNVDSNMKNILYFSQWCCTNEEISRYLEDFQELSRMPSISAENNSLRNTALNTYDRLKEEFYNTHSTDYIKRVLVSPSNRKNYLQISDTYATSTSKAADLVYENKLLQSLLHAPDYSYRGLTPDPLLIDGGQLFLPIIRPIQSPYNQKNIGWVYLTVSDRILLDYLNTFPLEADSRLYVTIGDHSYRYEDNALKESALPKLQKSSSGAFFHPGTSASILELEEGQKRTAVTCPLSAPGCSVTQVLSGSLLRTQLKIYTTIMLAIVSFIFFTGLLLYLLLNRIIDRPVHQLLSRITAISDGDFSKDPAIEWPDEFGIIGTGINRMSENVLSLMDKKVEDEKQRKNLEYQILQSQINPHFLYNTLNSIKWMATIQGASGISEMTTALAKLMKNVSKGTETKIPLKEELELVQNYFLIQQYRYGGSISLDCDIEEGLDTCLIHRFSLQPIVENALFHGIEPKGCAGKIQIRAWSETDADGKRLVRISVTDNGIGMTQETIDRVLKGDARPTADFFRQVGISNVSQRIQYDYGEQYGIEIQSTPGSYTTMTITLPLVTGKEGC